MKLRSTTNYYYPSLAEFGLDFTDAAILDWIYTFAFSASMLSMELYSAETKKSETYYWVNYESLISDFNGALDKKGILDITSKSGLAKRLAILVAKNILYFYQGNLVSKDGIVHKGTYTFYAINRSVYLKLIGEKVNSPSLVEAKPEEEARQKKFIHSSPAQETSPRLDGRTPVAATGEPNIIKLEYNKATSSSSQEKEQDKKAAFVPSCPEGKDTDDDEEVLKTLENIKGFDKSLVPSGITEKIQSLLEEKGITGTEAVKDYIDYVKGEILKRQSIKNPAAYFAKSIASAAARDAYVASLEKKDGAKDKDEKATPAEPLKTAEEAEAVPPAVKKPEKDYMRIKCPVCSTEHHISTICPECSLNDVHDENAVKRAGYIYRSWSPEKRTLYYAECDRLRLEAGLTVNPQVLKMRLNSLFEQYDERK